MLGGSVPYTIIMLVRHMKYTYGVSSSSTLLTFDCLLQQFDSPQSCVPFSLQVHHFVHHGRCPLLLQLSYLCPHLLHVCQRALVVAGWTIRGKTIREGRGGITGWGRGWGTAGQTVREPFSPSFHIIVIILQGLHFLARTVQKQKPLIY